MYFKSHKINKTNFFYYYFFNQKQLENQFFKKHDFIDFKNVICDSNYLSCKDFANYCFNSNKKLYKIVSNHTVLSTSFNIKIFQNIT